MKAGDKVYCKAELYINDTIYFRAGKWYIIVEIDNHDNSIGVFYNAKGNSYWMNILGSNACDCNFVDYFYSKKEVRKLKLEKLERGG